VRGAGYWGPGTVRVWHEEWNRPAGAPVERSYMPDFPEFAAEARAAGHGGGDFWTNFHFARAIRAGGQPYLDVYRGLAMSMVGVLGWRSALEDGRPIEVPDFKKEAVRKRYENDHWSPWPKDRDAAPNQPPPTIRGTPRPSARAVKHAREVWKGMGYGGE
jgi:hypothetical protein